MHPLFLLAIATFVLIIGFLAYNLISNRRHKFNRPVSGIGGENDPLSGQTDRVRKPDELRASLDDAATYNAQR